MDEEHSSIHTFEIDADSWIVVEVSRRWPKYVASWSVRRRSGDSDFPVKSGEVECMPPRNGAELQDTLDSLRDDARTQAIAAVEGERPPEQRKGLFSRLFGG